MWRKILKTTGSRGPQKGSSRGEYVGRDVGRPRPSQLTGSGGGLAGRWRNGTELHVATVRFRLGSEPFAAVVPRRTPAEQRRAAWCSPRTSRIMSSLGERRRQVASPAVWEPRLSAANAGHRLMKVTINPKRRCQRCDAGNPDRVNRIPPFWSKPLSWVMLDTVSALDGSDRHRGREGSNRPLRDEACGLSICDPATAGFTARRRRLSAQRPRS